MAYQNKQLAEQHYEDAKKLVLEHQTASVSFLQNKLNVAYNTGVLILRMLEKNGVVGAFIGNRPREVFYTTEGNPKNVEA